MDLRTFRRNGPGLAECESEAPWRRLWGGPSGASVPGHARTGLERGRILATIWIHRPPAEDNPPYPVDTPSCRCNRRLPPHGSRWRHAAVSRRELTTVLTTTVTTVAVPATPPTRPFAAYLAWLRLLPAPGMWGSGVRLPLAPPVDNPFATARYSWFRR